MQLRPERQIHDRQQCVLASGGTGDLCTLRAACAVTSTVFHSGDNLWIVNHLPWYAAGVHQCICTKVHQGSDVTQPRLYPVTYNWTDQLIFVAREKVCSQRRGLPTSCRREIRSRKRLIGMTWAHARRPASATARCTCCGTQSLTHRCNTLLWSWMPVDAPADIRVVPRSATCVLAVQIGIEYLDPYWPQLHVEELNHFAFGPHVRPTVGVWPRVCGSVLVVTECGSLRVVTGVRFSVCGHWRVVQCDAALGRCVHAIRSSVNAARVVD